MQHLCSLPVNNYNVIILSKLRFISPSGYRGCHHSRQFSCGRSLSCTRNICSRCWLRRNVFCCRFNDYTCILQCHRNNCISSVLCDILVKILVQTSRKKHICHVIMPPFYIKLQNNAFMVSCYPEKEV